MCKIKLNLFSVTIFSIVILLLSIGLLQATQVYKQNEIIDLKVQCIINGTFCSSSSLCNISIEYPNSSLLVNNQAMTNQISFYNFTLPNSNTLGDYSCSATCFDSGNWGTNECNYQITPSGTNLTIDQAILYIGALAIAFIIFLILLYASIVIPFYNKRNNEGIVVAINKLKMIKVGAVAFAYATFTFIVGLLDGLCNNFIYIVGVGKFFDWLYWIMASLAYPLIIVCAGLGFVIFIHDWLLKKKLKRLRFKYR